MPFLNEQGITLDSQSNLYTQMSGLFMQIYAVQDDITSASQDGQMINGFIQIVQDAQTLVLNDYNSRDANSATGTQLDTLFWGLPRQGATQTVQPLSLVVNAAATLYGLDQTVNPALSYQDPNGNVYQLQTTQNPSGAGTYVYPFVAQTPGNITSPLNTITVPVTVNLAVTSANNPTTFTYQGQNAESDFIYRLRGLASSAIASQGFFNSLYAALGSVQGITKVTLYNNPLTAPSPNQYCPVVGVPGNSVWAIITGSPQPSAVAAAIYANWYANTVGGQSYEVTQADSSMFPVYWDYVALEPVWIEFTASSIDGVNAPKTAAIIAGIPAILNAELISGATMNINQVEAAVQQIDPNTLVTSCQISSTSSSGPWSNTLIPTAANYQLEAVSANISIQEYTLGINPATLTILELGTETFSETGGVTPYTYSLLQNNSGGTINASTGAYVAGTTTISVTDKVQVTDAYGNTAVAVIVVNPYVVSVIPPSPSVVPRGTVNFTSSGGYGTITWAISHNESGVNAMINSSTGVYSAGNAAGTDTISATDSLGNIGYAHVSVS